MTWRIHALFAVLATCAVAFAVGWGFMIVGTPSARRVERFDEQRLRDLQAIVREIHALTVDTSDTPSLKAPLPATLDDVAQKARSERITLKDPETDEPYRYRVTSETTFELCATFTAIRDADYSVYWNHPAGEHCFTINVLDPPPFY